MWNGAAAIREEEERPRTERSGIGAELSGKGTARNRSDLEVNEGESKGEMEAQGR